ncbi:uncharacterized protein LOC117304431 [Asterias rubens]|uniref:uncharacterized protein LOC117304431 n=1 Tax=Asterias rubens TaxID=7604 RepID=UPI0014558F2B|nr:uncharacterized protein LOC117304431 [Asterias rubens]
MDTNSTSMTTVPSSEQLSRDGSVFVVAFISLCVGLINSLVIVLTIMWLYRHYKVRSENDQSRKIKTGKPSKVLSIDYKMTSLDMMTADEYCPQRYTSSTNERMASTGQQVGHTDRQVEMDNGAFTVDPESVQFEPPDHVNMHPSRGTL